MNTGYIYEFICLKFTNSYFYQYRKIELFDVTRIGGKKANHTDIKFTSDRTAKITVSWIPVEADIGTDILCARVEDNEGLVLSFY